MSYDLNKKCIRFRLYWTYRVIFFIYIRNLWSGRVCCNFETLLQSCLFCSLYFFWFHYLRKITKQTTKNEELKYNWKVYSILRLDIWWVCMEETCRCGVMNTIAGVSELYLRCDCVDQNIICGNIKLFLCRLPLDKPTALNRVKFLKLKKQKKLKLFWIMRNFTWRLIVSANLKLRVRQLH